MRRDLVLGSAAGRHSLNSGFHLGLRGLQLFQMKFKLFELNNDLLALDAEHPAPQLLDDQLQMLDLLAAGTRSSSIWLTERLALALDLSFPDCDLRIPGSGDSALMAQ